MKRALLAAANTSRHFYLKNSIGKSVRPVPFFLSQTSLLPTSERGYSSSRMWLSSSNKNEEGDPSSTNVSTTMEEEKVDIVPPTPESNEIPEETVKYTVPVDIRMPDMSDGHDNTVDTWYKQPGDTIKYNDILCDISTQDFTFGLSMDDNHDAIMGEIHVEAGTKAKDGARICTIYHPEVVAK